MNFRLILHRYLNLIVILLLFSLQLFYCKNYTPGKISPVKEEYPTAESWRSSGKYLLSPYGKIFTKELREGETILLLHGYPGNSYDFFPLSAKLKGKILLLDFLGFGYSDKPQNLTYSIHIQTEIVEKILKEKKINEFYIVAHDYGITVAQELLSRVKDNLQSQNDYFKIKGIIFLGNGVIPYTYKTSFLDKILLSSFGEFFEKLINKEIFLNQLLEKYDENSRPSKFELEENWKIINYQNGNSLSHKLLYFIQDREYNTVRYTNSMISQNIPIKIIYGSNDPLYSSEEISQYHELGLEENLYPLNAIGHYPHIESYIEVSNIINSIIKSQEK